VDAPATLNGRRQDASTLQVLKSVAANRNPFPERTKPTITVIYSRFQEAQVYADFCQPLRASDSTLSFQPNLSNRFRPTCLSLPELTHANRMANADVIALIRGGGSDEQFSLFENPELLRAWSEKRAHRVAGIGHSGNSTALDLLSDFAAITPSAAGTHITDALRTRRDSQHTSRNCEHRTRSGASSCAMCRGTPYTTADAVTGFAVATTSGTNSAERTNCAQVSACPSDRNAHGRDTAAVVHATLIKRIVKNLNPIESKRARPEAHKQQKRATKSSCN
jgi:hypothetical protein